MMTVITRLSLKAGTEPEWDKAMQDRLGAAKDRPGWVGIQLLVPEGSPQRRLIVGTWKSRDEWESWHEDPAFLETRQRLEGLQDAPSDTQWCDVMTDAP